MTANADPANALQNAAQKILQSHKYRDLDIPEATVLDLLEREMMQQKNLKTAEQKTREKLHQIIAPYLGDPDYAAAADALREAAASGDAAVRAWCERMLLTHASTRERFPQLEAFYAQIFQITGVPRTVLDLACAMNPFAFPWMGLGVEVKYHAYDLHQPRVRLINQFFEAIGLAPFAEKRDILLDVPEIHANMAFFFKEAHRFEARQKGCCRAFFERIQTEWIVVTLPAENLTGQHQMRERQHRLIERAVEGKPWNVQIFEVGTEMIFCIRKNG